MTEVASSCFFNRIVVHVDDLVQVADKNLGDFMEFPEVIFAVNRIDEGWQGKRGQVADSNLIGSRKLNDLSAKI